MTKKTGIKEVSGTLIAVDKTLFLQAAQFLMEHKLLDRFAEHLDKAGLPKVLIDVRFANEVKRFLSRAARTDAFGRMVIASSCNGNGGGGGGGGGTAGVRG
jgi:hypothetical protein